MFLPHPRVKVSIVGSLRDREVACSASDRQGSNFESCVWRTVSSQSSHHPQEVLLAQFSLYVHKGGLKPESFHFAIIISSSSITFCHLIPERYTRDAWRPNMYHWIRSPSIISSSYVLFVLTLNHLIVIFQFGYISFLLFDDNVRTVDECGVFLQSKFCNG